MQSSFVQRLLATGLGLALLLGDVACGARSPRDPALGERASVLAPGRCFSAAIVDLRPPIDTLWVALLDDTVTTRVFADRSSVRYRQALVWTDGPQDRIGWWRTAGTDTTVLVVGFGLLSIRFALTEKDSVVSGPAEFRNDTGEFWRSTEAVTFVQHACKVTGAGTT